MDNQEIYFVSNETRVILPLLTMNLRPLLCPFTDAFHKEPLELDLVFACVGDMNTTVRSGLAWPIIYGIGN